MDKSTQREPPAVISTWQSTIVGYAPWQGSASEMVIESKTLIAIAVATK
ncbi:hypothetical protein [Rubellicoccus peritrichatus]|uniref:Uncharacterized protein n=1 Tax=Rubellicoccus peritrichatus TaxID=3080537 RepID=A0AAQ3QUY5_9BACT|nr:hypothetical protein [Puniceicoccus sp. CR14]WOO40307.1 hypothetical protein RZN69_16935 [Puniceicoccus sp. CR14]